MSKLEVRPVAVVGTAAIMPQAPSGDAFWANITGGRYCVTEVPPERWDPALYYDADHGARDKTYSTIGGWVREFDWNPIAWKLPVPPTVAAQMDEGQRWAISAARAALTDAGWPKWNVESDRVAVILGNAIGGEKHYKSSMRIQLPEVLKRLQESATLRSLSPEAQRAIVEETRAGYLDNMFEITEDTMPGELANVIAGRVANLFNLRGPNFTTDAACASGLAALSSAVHGLVEHDYDAVITGGIDRNMGIDAFVKFCKIGALSATGTRPFDAGADGFVMGEGAALFVLKRLEDAERDGDHIYATILGIGGSSDGKGKGITAPNPVGQQLAVRRAWENAHEDPSTASAVEAHGTSTRVGDAAELESLTKVFGASGARPGSIALGSVKSNIGHLKAAAGTAGLFKMVRSLDLQTAHLADDVGRGLFGILPRTLPTLAVGALTTGLFLPHAVAPYVLGIGSALLAVVLSSACRYALGVLGFWVVDARGLQTLYMVVGSFLAGLFIPVPLMPHWLQVLAAATPFPSLLMAPVDIISGRVTGLAAYAVLAQQGLWLVGAWALGAVLTRAGARRLEVQGG